MQTENFQSPAFIVGCPRSGTTLLSAILNRHPDICVTPETNFLYLLSQLPNTNEGFKENWPQTLYDIADSMAPTDTWNKPAKQVYEKLNGQPTTGKDAFLVLGQLIANKSNKPLWIEKTPNHVHCLPFIRQLFPKAPIINIIRDGRDVAHSLTKVKFGSIIYFENLLLWINTVKKTKEFERNDNHILSIKYEDLIAAPEETTQQICNFLSVSYFHSMLEPQASDHALIEKTANHKSQVSKLIDKNKLATWKQTLSHQLQKTALMISYHELVNNGYALPYNDATLSLNLSKLLLESRHHQELYNEILDAIANGKKSYALSSTETLTENKKIVPPRLWVTDEAPLPDFELRTSHVQNLLFLLKILQRLISLKLHGTQVVWVLHPENNPSETWVIRKISEFLMSKLATNIIIALDDDNKIAQTINHYHLNDKKCLFSSKPTFSQQLNKLFA